MASLPSNTFMFNYNAKQYNPSTYTFPKTEGQLFDFDLVLNGAPSSYDDVSVSFTNNARYMLKSYTASENPFNVTSSNPNFTFIYKTSGWTSDDTNLFSNRGGSFNFMMRANRCIFGTEYCVFPATNNPQYIAITVDSNGIATRKELNSDGSVVQSASTAITYGGLSNSVNFFAGTSSGGENFRKVFYWMYCSRETLTDSEILQVIKYNESDLNWVPFEPDSFSFDQYGGTNTLTLTGDPDSGTTFDIDWSWSSGETDWFDIEPSTNIVLSANQTTSCTITVDRNYDSARTKTIYIKDRVNDETLGTLSLSQDAYQLYDQIHPNKVLFNDNPVLKEYLNNNNVMRIFYNGEEIFRRVSFMPSLALEKDTLTFRITGGTDTVGISANTTYTASSSASWLTITTASTGISVTAADYSTGTEDRTATINVVCNNGDFSVSSSITVTQKVSNFTEVSYIIMENGSWYWNPSYCITTPIVMQNNYKVRLKYKYSGNGTDRLVGFTWKDTDIYGNSISDNADFRVFYYSNGSYDFQNQRRSQNNIMSTGTEYDITLGNYSLYDNKTGTYKFNSSSANLTTEAYIRVDACNYIKELIVYDGNDNIIFDGKAGYDVDNHIGLYDEVSEQMYYNPDLNMTYEE